MKKRVIIFNDTRVGDDADRVVLVQEFVFPVHWLNGYSSPFWVTIKRINYHQLTESDILTKLKVMYPEKEYRYIQVGLWNWFSNLQVFLYTWFGG